jgi:hypothetical protein
MMLGFTTELDTHLKGENTFVIDAPLVYVSDLLYWPITVPVGFKTDLASVPRVPIVYEAWGNRCHREAVIHDYLYRIGADPEVSWLMANSIFLEAMKSRGVALWIRYPMYWGTCIGGWKGWKKEKV